MKAKRVSTAIAKHYGVNITVVANMTATEKKDRWRDLPSHAKNIDRPKKPRPQRNGFHHRRFKKKR